MARKTGARSLSEMVSDRSGTDLSPPRRGEVRYGNRPRPILEYLTHATAAL